MSEAKLAGAGTQDLLSKIVAFLRRYALPGLACAFVLFPIVVLAPLVTVFPELVVIFLIVSIFVLYLVYGANYLLRRLRRPAAIFLASVLLLPSAAINAWLVDFILESRARAKREREWAQELQHLFERVRAEGSVPVSSLADGWDRVCMVTPYNEFADGRLQMEDGWGLEFFSGAEVVATRDYRVRDVELVYTSGQHCLPRTQEPAFFIASDDRHPQALRIRPTRP